MSINVSVSSNNGSRFNHAFDLANAGGKLFSKNTWLATFKYFIQEGARLYARMFVAVGRRQWNLPGITYTA